MSEYSRFEFGMLRDGTRIEAVELDDGKGARARIITLGAALQSLWIPDREGRSADVVLGFDNAADYLSNAAYFGVTVGRYANRIAGAAFMLDGQRFELARNEGSSALHGGMRGFGRAVWKIEHVSGGAAPSVTLSHVSPDGDEGYPGTLAISATYALATNTETDTELTLEYQATTDKPTIVNITGHSYFQLAGEGAAEGALDQELSIHADAFLPIDASAIPLGDFRPVAGTPFDFRRSMRIAARLREAADQQIVHGGGYNHCFVLDAGSDQEPRPVARLKHAGSGRVMELLTTAPGLQLYSGNNLTGTDVGKSGRTYRQGDGVCLEPQGFPDAPNRPNFPSVRLDPGQIYRHKIIYRFKVV